GTAVDMNLTGVLAIRAAENLHQGGFAGPILAEQHVDVASLERQIDAIEGDHTRERLADAPHLEHRRRRRGHSDSDLARRDEVVDFLERGHAVEGAETRAAHGGGSIGGPQRLIHRLSLDERIDETATKDISGTGRIDGLYV